MKKIVIPLVYIVISFVLRSLASVVTTGLFQIMEIDQNYWFIMLLNYSISLIVTVFLLYALYGATREKRSILVLIPIVSLVVTVVYYALMMTMFYHTLQRGFIIWFLEIVVIGLHFLPGIILVAISLREQDNIMLKRLFLGYGILILVFAVTNNYLWYMLLGWLEVDFFSFSMEINRIISSVVLVISTFLMAGILYYLYDELEQKNDALHTHPDVDVHMMTEYE